MDTLRLVPRLLPAAAASLALLLTPAGDALAQAKYPSRTVEVVVPYAPGGGTDNLMRMITGIIDENKWSPVPLNVNNRAGGSGAVGFSYLINKKGDSHVVAGATPMIVSGKIEGRLPRQSSRRDDDADDRRHRRAHALGAHRVAVQDDRRFRQRGARQARAAHRRRHRHAHRGSHLHLPVRAGGEDQGEVRALQLGRRGDGRADGRPHRRRRHEPERDRRRRSRPARRRTWRSPRASAWPTRRTCPPSPRRATSSTGSRCAASSGRPTWRPRRWRGGRTR